MDRALGCDVSTERIALADSDGRATSIELPPRKGRVEADHLAASHAAIVDRARRFVGRRTLTAAFVEWPGGRVHPSLWQMFGVTLAAIYLALRDTFAYPVSVWSLPVSQWKGLSVGNGSASKAAVAEWVRSRGWSAANQDECDALGVACAGLVMLTKGAV